MDRCTLFKHLHWFLRCRFSRGLSHRRFSCGSFRRRSRRGFRWRQCRSRSYEWRSGQQATVTVCGKRDVLTVPQFMTVGFPSLLELDFLSGRELIHTIVLHIQNNECNIVENEMIFWNERTQEQVRYKLHTHIGICHEVMNWIHSTITNAIVQIHTTVKRRASFV